MTWMPRSDPLRPLGALRPLWARVVCGVAGAACGVVLALSLPPFGWWPLAWAAFAGLALMLPGLRLRERLATGFGFGLGQYVIGLFWVQEFTVWGCVALMLLSALFDTVALALVPAQRRRGVVFGLPAVIVLADWARDRFPLGGLPLGSASLGQVSSPLAHVLRMGGPLLLDAATVLAGVAIAQLVLALDASRPIPTLTRSHRARPATADCVVVVAVVALAAGLAPLTPSGAGGGLSPLRVALVQGGGPRGTRAVQTDPQVVFDRHLQASESLDPPLGLVLWPEGILQSDGPYQQSADAADLAALARRTHSTVVAGVEQDVGSTRYINEVVAWNPDGKIVGTYVKNHLVPFGEYIPDRSLVKRFFNVSDVPLDAIPGHGPGILHTAAGSLGVTISFEIFFDDRVLPAIQAGGQVLLVPTNTASYRSTQVPAQELAAARLAAQETGRWVLQVTPTGYTAVVAPNGGVRKRSTLSLQQVLMATVPLETGRTWYVDLGDSPFAGGALVLWVVALGASGVLAAAMRRSRRRFPKVRRREPAPPQPTALKIDAPEPPSQPAAAQPAAAQPAGAQPAGAQPAAAQPAAAQPAGSPAPATRSKAAIVPTRAQHATAILFVCTGNQCRSPMATALLRRQLAARRLDISVSSAGFVSEGRRPPPEAVQVMEASGIDISMHRSRRVDATLLHSSALVITMSRQHLIDIATSAPDVWQRCFTFTDLLYRARLNGGRRTHETIAEWVNRMGAGRLRSSILSIPLQDDIPDPMGRAPGDFLVLRDSLEAMCAELVGFLSPA